MAEAREYVQKHLYKHRMMDISDLQQKAESGSVAAQSMLGICYLDGIEVDINYPEAFRFLSAASEKGAPRALANLARMYAEGLGTQKDLTKAIQLFERAADAGEFFAQVELGRIYTHGKGVPVNHQAAYKWYSAAAAQKDRVQNCAELDEAIAYRTGRNAP